MNGGNRDVAGDIAFRNRVFVAGVRAYRWVVAIIRVGLVAVAALLLAGCSENEIQRAADPAPTAVGAPISKSTWTDGRWQFTVSEGQLKCYSEDSMVTFTTGGVEYGLNATARRFGNFSDIGEVMLVGREGYVEVNGTRQQVKTYAVSLDRILASAAKLCA